MKNTITKEDLYDISTISAYFFTEHLGNEFDEFIDNKAELKEIKRKLKSINFSLFKKEIIRKINERIEEIKTEDEFWN